MSNHNEVLVALDKLSHHYGEDASAVYSFPEELAERAAILTRARVAKGIYRPEVLQNGLIPILEDTFAQLNREFMAGSSLVCGRSPEDCGMYDADFDHCLRAGSCFIAPGVVTTDISVPQLTFYTRCFKALLPADENGEPDNIAIEVPDDKQLNMMCLLKMGALATLAAKTFTAELNRRELR